MLNKSFTINDLERFSGIKAHTLRIWERRYALLQPIRSAGNFRVYTLDELKKILDIALLNKNGYRISGLSKTDPSVIKDKVRLLPFEYNKWQKAINDLTIQMYTFDPGSFEWILDELLLIWPIDILVEKIIYPFLKTTRLLWVGNKLCEEHLVVTAIRKKLILAIETAPLLNKPEKTILLFLPDSKQLDLGLLYGNYFLKKRGIHVLYLGTDVSIQNLKSIFYVHPPKFIFTYLSLHHHFPTHKLLECMDTYAPTSKLIIGKYTLDEDDPGIIPNMVQLPYQEALDYLEKK